MGLGGLAGFQAAVDGDQGEEEDEAHHAGDEGGGLGAHGVPHVPGVHVQILIGEGPVGKRVNRRTSLKSPL